MFQEQNRESQQKLKHVVSEAQDMQAMFRDVSDKSNSTHV